MKADDSLLLEGVRLLLATVPLSLKAQSFIAHLSFLMQYPENWLINE